LREVPECWIRQAQPDLQLDSTGVD
jgi:hypothetical protein